MIWMMSSWSVDRCYNNISIHVNLLLRRRRKMSIKVIYNVINKTSEKVMINDRKEMQFSLKGNLRTGFRTETYWSTNWCTGRAKEWQTARQTLEQIDRRTDSLLFINNCWNEFTLHSNHSYQYYIRDVSFILSFIKLDREVYMTHD